MSESLGQVLYQNILARTSQPLFDWESLPQTAKDGYTAIAADVVLAAKLSEFRVPHSTIMIVDAIREYVTKLETRVTTEHCICRWEIHPDDKGELPEGKKRRMRLADTHPWCPAHSKEGFLFGFLDYMTQLDWLKEATSEVGELGNEPTE